MRSPQNCGEKCDVAAFVTPSHVGQLRSPSMSFSGVVNVLLHATVTMRYEALVRVSIVGMGHDVCVLKPQYLSGLLSSYETCIDNSSSYRRACFVLLCHLGTGRCLHAVL